MPCEHRFRSDLYPQEPLKYLFVGTFNPSWDRPQKDDAEWFYGRPNNDFWFIMPQVLGSSSLMDRKFRRDRRFLMNWCKSHAVGLTDLIEDIQDCDIENQHHKDLILSVNDNAFDLFGEVIPTKVTTIIDNNAQSLCGVYLTRYQHTLPENGVINILWNSIKETCNRLNIHCSELVTPSRNFRQLNRIQKLEGWTNTISICSNLSYY